MAFATRPHASIAPAILATTLISALMASAALVEYGVKNVGTALPVALMLAIISLLTLIAAQYASAREWLFSSGFWIAVTVGFYIILKAITIIVADEVETIVAPLGGTALFLAGYAVSCWTSRRSITPSPHSGRRLRLAEGGVWVVAALFAAFQLLGLALAAQSGATVLEVSNATQNGGAAFFYRLPLISNAFFLIVLDTAYRLRRHYWLALLMTLVIVGTAVLSSNRSQILIVILWNMYFYNRYIQPLNIAWLALLSPPMVFVIVLFGYVRNIGVGDISVVVDALSYFQGNKEAIVDLFMARLDMLPQMGKGFDLYAADLAPQLNGSSYINSFLHLVPRSIWPDKPPLTAALLTAITDPGPFADGVLFYPSVVVEALFNFGWAGILLAGVATGALARSFDALLSGSSLVLSTWVLLFFTFPMGLFNEGFHSNFTGGVLYMTALFGVAIGLLRLTRALVR